MKKMLCIYLLFSACSSLAYGQQRLEKALLWEISGKGLPGKSYLYGTIHLMCPEDLKVNEKLQTAFERTKALYLEIKTDDPNMMSEMLAGMPMKDSSTIKSLLGASCYDSVSSIFKTKTGIPLQMFDKAKPVLVVSMIYPSLMECTPGSWEKTFEEMAKGKNMPINGLEKLSDQMKVLESIPYKEQALMLKKTMYNLDSAKAQFANMLSIYKAKDVQQLYDMTVSDVEFGQFETSLIVNRNRNWIPVIQSQVLKIPTFFAVGAAHLAGENGVIRLLQKEGFTVKPVMY